MSHNGRIFIEHRFNKVFKTQSELDATVQFLTSQLNSVNLRINKVAEGWELLTYVEPDVPMTQEDYEQRKAQHTLPALFDNQRFVFIS